MKKVILLFIVLLLSACTPQVTVTPTPLPTQTPVPTPTLHPQFIELQNLINDSSERFALTSDGTIQENGVVIAGLYVDANGVMILTVDNEEIIITVDDVVFSEDGIQINGYELDENGEWVEAKSATIVNGLEMVLGNPDGQGNRPVLEFIPPTELSFNVTEEDWLARLDPTEIGYDSGELNWVVNGATGAIELQSSDGDAVATWKEVGTKGKSTVVWNAMKMGQGDDHPFHTIGIVYDVSGGRVVNYDEQKANFHRQLGLSRIVSGELAFEFGLDWKQFFFGLQIFSTDRTTAVIAGYFYDGIESEDFVTILTPDGEVKGFLVENIEGSAIVDPSN